MECRSCMLRSSRDLIDRARAIRLGLSHGELSEDYEDIVEYYNGYECNLKHIEVLLELGKGVEDIEEEFWFQYQNLKDQIYKLPENDYDECYLDGYMASFYDFLKLTEERK